MILTKGLGDQLFSFKLAQTRLCLSALLSTSGNVVGIAVQHDFQDGLAEKYLTLNTHFQESTLSYSKYVKLCSMMSCRSR
jgi:mannose/fructose/N-acetylgalactosamine-specific phosphotransferase system component IID